jgi:hypothetical protein
MNFFLFIGNFLLFIVAPFLIVRQTIEASAYSEKWMIMWFALSCFIVLSILLSSTVFGITVCHDYYELIPLVIFILMGAAVAIYAYKNSAQFITTMLQLYRTLWRVDQDLVRTG